MTTYITGTNIPTASTVTSQFTGGISPIGNTPVRPSAVVMPLYGRGDFGAGSSTSVPTTVFSSSGMPSTVVSSSTTFGPTTGSAVFGNTSIAPGGGPIFVSGSAPLRYTASAASAAARSGVTDFDTNFDGIKNALADFLAAYSADMASLQAMLRRSVEVTLQNMDILRSQVGSWARQNCLPASIPKEQESVVIATTTTQ